MKSIILIAALIIMSSKAIFAQHSHDPSYSVHNYKHPNKASEAKLNDYDHLMKFNYLDVKQSTHRNYKAQNHSEAPHEGGDVPAKPVERRKNSVFSSGNYKRQF